MAAIDSADLKSRVEAKLASLVSGNAADFEGRAEFAQAIAEAIVEHLSNRDVEVTNVVGTCPSGGGPLVFTSGTARISSGT